MAKKDHLPAQSDQELIALLIETRATLRTERFAAAGARPKDSNALKKLRRTIARILTEQRARSASSRQAVAE